MSDPTGGTAAGLDDGELLRALRSVGFAAFVEHFETLTDASLTVATAIDRLAANSLWNEAGRRMRVGNARRIVRAGRVDDALRLVAAAGRVEPRIVEAARRRLAERTADRR